MPINLYKPIGLTPLEATESFRRGDPKHKDKRMSYAGRLDPVAEGVLIALVGDETKEQEKYQNLDKEYEAEILFGFSSDSYDVLGMPRPLKKIEAAIIDREKDLIELEKNIDSRLKEFQGKTKLGLPPHSSYKIKGKPLFWWARNGRLQEIEVPERNMEFYKIEIKEIKRLNHSDILKSVTDKVGRVKGDFRQEKILKKWEEILTGSGKQSVLLTLGIHCSSGTYVRSLADELGKKTENGALLYSLKRTRVGDFRIEDSVVVKY